MTSAAELITELRQRGETVASCESLTAGLFSATLASVPGASAVLRGGLITYATELKHLLAGVPTTILEKDGPVAASTAIAMAQGAQNTCRATWGISLTGVAGPEPQDGHDVGEVWIGVAGPASSIFYHHLHLSSRGSARETREYIRQESVNKGIEFLLDILGTNAAV
ncbi:nicotinamide-nucleotide amidohydrolase family protein [Corynebacterium sp. 3HC-13]|uniref:CinA family protein n=1 Tax=Corynebacterium poyangense TaxID=2684405 RepID=UPI001CCCCF9C|nr:CinA family protein [Corynebacterium poyangense]MBZ8177991.1 nicotinamide-nucleotide amidohydrolase family protein [Corynebacterium poyangense]